MQRTNLRKQKKINKQILKEIRIKTNSLPESVDYNYNGKSELYEVPINHYRRIKRLLKKTKDINLVNNYIESNK